jgi:NAD(P)-dependent dehydrogenase (short-subunit alcohol dehydrogenase family)
MITYNKDRMKTAIVTGGNGGIGKAIVEALVQKNIRVLVVGRDAAKGAQTETEMKALGGEVVFVALDLSKPDEIHQFANEVLAQEGQIDILVNNAGISGFMGPIVDTPLEKLEEIFAVNITGTFLLTQLVLQKMMPSGWGRIVNISSIATRINPSNSACYNMTKAALDSFTKTLAKEVGGFGITVNAIAPGLILTDRIKKQRLPGMAEKAGVSPAEMLKRLTVGTATGKLTEERDIAFLTAFLVSDEAGNITGEIIDVAGGA